MKKTVILFLTILITISILQLGCGTSEENESSSFEKGEALLSEFKFEEADEIYKKFSERDSLNYKGFYGSALVDEYRFKFIDALIKYMTVVETADDYAPAYLGLYRMYRFFDMPSEASMVGFKYIKLAGASIESSRLKAEILLESNSSKRLRNEISNQSHFDSHKGEKNFIIAQTYLLENSFDSAQYYFEQGLKNSEESPSYFLAASDYLEKIGLIDSAITLSSKAIELSNYDYLTTIDHYFKLLNNNYFNQANNLIDKLQSLGLDDGTRQLLIYYNYFYQPRYNMSRYALNEFMRQGNSGYCNNFYDFLVSCKKDEGNTPSDLMKLVLSEMSRSGYPEEILHTVNYIMLRYLSETLNPIYTLKEIDRLPGIYSAKKETKLMKIEQLYLSGQAGEAEAEMKALSKASAKRADWLTSIGNIYKNKLIRKYDKAERNYKDALDIDKWFKPAFENYIQMFRDIGNYKKSLKVFKDYPYFEKKYSDLKILKAVCLVESGDFEKGLKLLEQSIGNKKEDLTIFADVLYAARIQNNNSATEKILELMEKFNEHNSKALSFTSDIYLRLKNYDKSKELSRKAFELNNKNYDAKAVNAFANYKTGQVKSAEQILDSIIIEDRYNSKANMYLAQLLVTEGRDYQKASNLARKAISLSQYGYDEWMTLCFAYYQMGRYDLCRAEAIKSSHKYTEFPLPFYWLGLSQFEENKDGAKGNLKNAIKLGLSGEQLKLANEVIKRL